MKLKKLIAWMLALCLTVSHISTFAAMLPLLSLPKSMRIIEEEAFCGSTSIARVHVPEGTYEIRSRAFAESSLKEISLPASLVFISESAFEGCEAFAVNAVEGSYAHRWAMERGYIAVEPTDTANFRYELVNETYIRIISYSGSDPYVSVPAEIDGYPVKEIGDTCFFCNSNLISVYLPDSLTTIGQQAFDGCSKLTGVRIPGNVTTIESQAFSNCSKLASVILPDSLTAISSGLFTNCSSLNYILIPGKTQTIGSYAFKNCISLHKAALGAGVHFIEDYAFQGCIALGKTSLPENLNSIAPTAFDNCTSFVAKVVKNSYPHNWCLQNDIAFILMESGATPAPSVNTSVGPTATPVPVTTPEPDLSTISYRALLIGNTYPDTSLALHAPDDDVSAVSKMLTRQLKTPYDITSKFNQSGSQMLASITSAFAGADENDVSLFYYSGHGERSGALVGIGNTSVSIAQLREQLDTIPGKKIVLLDCCYSGAYIGRSTGGDAASFNDAVISAFSVKSRSNLASDAYTVLTACSQNEMSYESSDPSSGSGFGFFTCGIARGSGFDPATRKNCDMYADYSGDNNGETILSEAYNYAVDTVKSFTDSVNITQNVQYYGDLNAVLWSCGKQSDPGLILPPSGNPSATLNLPLTPTPTISPVPTPTPTPDPNAGETVYRALLIGNTYPGMGDELRSPDDNVEGMAKMLTRQSATPYDITTKLNQSARQILTSISTVFADADSNDVSLFYFNGHGLSSLSFDLLGALCGVDSHFVTVSQLRAQLDTIPGNKIVLLDSCHSGAHIGKSSETASAKAFNAAIISAFASQSRDNLTSGNYTVLTAASQTQVGWEFYRQTDFCLFSAGIAGGSGYSLIEQKNCSMFADYYGDNNGETTLKEAYNYAADVVDDLASSIGATQNIQYHGDLNFVLWASGEPSDAKPTNTLQPSASPTLTPTDDPGADPTGDPGTSPTDDPGTNPTDNPGTGPTTSPTSAPTPTPEPVNWDLEYNLMFGDKIEITGSKREPSGTLELPASLDGYVVYAVGANAFAGCDQITELILPDTIESIDASAFKNCTAIRKVHLPAYLFCINSEAFSGCSALQEISLPLGLVQIADYAFRNCTGLTELYLPMQLNLLGTDIFAGCRSLHLTLVAGSAAETYCESNGYNYTTLPDASQGDFLIDGTTLILYEGSDASPEIPEGIETIGLFAFSGNDSLESIVLPNSLKVIEYGAFHSCPSLEYVEIQEGAIQIDMEAFYECTQLTNVVLPDSIKYIGSNAFCSCANLEEINMPSELVSIGSNAFYGCNSLKKLSFGEQLSEISSHAFDECENLARVSFAGGPVCLGSYAFSNCPSLKKVTLGNGINSIGEGAFYQSGLQEINLPDSLHSIGSSAFYYCTGLTTLCIPDSVSYIGPDDPFRHCWNLTIYVNAGSFADQYCIGNGLHYMVGPVANPTPVPTLPPMAWPNQDPVWEIDYDYLDDYTTEALSISLDSETEVELPVNLYDSILTSIGEELFAGYDQISKIRLPHCIENIGASAFSGCSSLEEINIPENVAAIDDYAFENCSSLKEILLPLSLKSIGKNVFSGCSNLQITVYEGSTAEAYCQTNRLSHTSIPAPEGDFIVEGNLLVSYTGTDTSPVVPDRITAIGYRAFAENSSIQTVHLPSSLAHIHAGAFENCENLSEISIPEGVMRIESYAFSGCTSLKDIDLPDGMIWLEDCLFADCTNLISVDLPVNLKHISAQVFSNCSKLTSIEIPNGVERTGQRTFFGCTALKYVYLPDSILSIDNSAFRGCSSLQDFTLPPKLINIGTSAFQGCTSLVNIVLPDGITELNDYTFFGCSKLATIYAPWNIKSVQGYATFSNCSNLVVQVVKNSYMEKHCAAHNINFEYY